MSSTVGTAFGIVVPLILFGLALWLVFKALSAKFTVVVVVFLSTYALAESPLGTGVWHWLGAIAKAAGLPALTHHL